MEINFPIATILIILLANRYSISNQKIECLLYFYCMNLLSFPKVNIRVSSEVLDPNQEFFIFGGSSSTCCLACIVIKAISISLGSLVLFEIIYWAFFYSWLSFCLHYKKCLSSTFFIKSKINQRQIFRGHFEDTFLNTDFHLVINRSIIIFLLLLS